MLVESAHAKLNLSLAITGRRADGFHELVSLVVSLNLADTLSLEPCKPLGMTTDDASLPVDETNLVLKAALVYAKHRARPASGHFHLVKRIPWGAGLGGGSADAAAALRLLDKISENPLGPAALENLAAEVGSDCPFFVNHRSAIMRGRGERLAKLPDLACAALGGRSVVIVKPPFAISTPEAYRLLAKAGHYRDADEVEASFAAWMESPHSDPTAMGNDLAGPVFNKHLALPVGLNWLHRATGATWHLTGSGSACFALVDAKFDHTCLSLELQRIWGEGAWSCVTSISA